MRTGTIKPSSLKMNRKDLLSPQMKIKQARKIANQYLCKRNKTNLNQGALIS